MSTLGCSSDLLVLRSFPDLGALVVERERVLHSRNPFDVRADLRGLSMEAYQPFPFADLAAPGAHGAYEFRYYDLLAGGLAPTLDGWAEALPGRTPISEVFAAMYALDGEPRMLLSSPMPISNSGGMFRSGRRVRK
jgi:hypothetical protein